MGKRIGISVLLLCFAQASAIDITKKDLAQREEAYWKFKKAEAQREKGTFIPQDSLAPKYKRPKPTNGAIIIVGCYLPACVCDSVVIKNDTAKLWQGDYQHLKKERTVVIRNRSIADSIRSFVDSIPGGAYQRQVIDGEHYTIRKDGKMIICYNCLRWKDNDVAKIDNILRLRALLFKTENDSSAANIKRKKS